MHAQTLKLARYHLKTKHGISDTFYTNSKSTPIHGNGQGAGDSPSQWCQQSAMLFEIYGNHHKGASMTSPANTIQTQIPLVAFADDTNLMGNDDSHDQTADQLIQNAQDCFTTWNELLHASGHFMELKKCACYLSVWDFQEDGYAFTKEPSEIGRVITVRNTNNDTKIIKQLSATTSQKILGVMKNPIGNQQDEIKRLLEKSNRLATKLNSHALTRMEAKLAYELFYLPALRYSLSVTSINQIDLETIQKNMTSTIRSAMGFNRNMPREVVFGA
jgi:hypothetical protein